MAMNMSLAQGSLRCLLFHAFSFCSGVLGIRLEAWICGLTPVQLLGNLTLLLNTRIDFCLGRTHVILKFICGGGCPSLVYDSTIALFILLSYKHYTRSITSTFHSIRITKD